MKTKMIKIKITAVLVLFISAASCNYLDVVPSNIAVIEDAFKTRDNAERFLGSLYGRLPNYTSTGLNPALYGGDETLVLSFLSRNWDGTTLKSGGQTVNNTVFRHWGGGEANNLFVALRDCNIFLNNLDKPFDLREDEKTRWIAEAKFLKAYYHFYLMRMYGPIPIIKENIEVSEGVEAVKVERKPVDEVAAYIVQLLDEAITGLPDGIQDEQRELGRITKSIAVAIKARTLITVASPLFNGNSDYAGFNNAEGKPLISTQYDAAKWETAATACKEAIDMAEANGYALYEFTARPKGWSDTTIRRLSIRGALTERWNSEIIWGASGRAVAGLQNASQAKIMPGLTDANYWSITSIWGPPLHIAEMFYSENGVPIEEDKNYDYVNRYETKKATEEDLYRIQPDYETAKLHFNREPRFYASVGFDGGKWIGHGKKDDKKMLHLEAKQGQNGGKRTNTENSATGYFAKKLVYYKNVQSNTAASYSRTNYPFPVVRLTDLYLLYAEALNEAGKTGEAYPWIDKVRARAGLKGVVESWSKHSRNASKPGTQEGLRDIIHQERMIELVFEGHRFWDIRRWKRATEFFNRNLQGWNIDGKTTDEFYNHQSLFQMKFQQRDYLWPIAENDLIANNKLIQTKGWE